MGYDASYTRHQVAGGVLTTTRRQLAELRLEHRFDEVMAEVERVRFELGSPIMVTPFPQIVTTQALFNVLADERYSNITDQAIRYVLGRFGRPTAPVDQNVLDRIMALPRTREILSEPTMMTLKERRARFPASMSDEEFLLRAVMPADQVDAMHTRAPHGLYYNPTLSPVLQLLDGVRKRPAMAQFRVSQPDFSLELRSSSASQQ
jgi:oxaloacetate decarboxylase alpha subunit